MHITSDDFTEDSVELIQEVHNLAKQMKTKTITEYHIMVRLWHNLEIDMIHNDIISSREIDELSDHWFSQIKKQNDSIDNIGINKVVDTVIKSAKTLALELEDKQIKPAHLLYAMYKSKSPVRDVLKQHDLTPIKILKLL